MLLFSFTIQNITLNIKKLLTCFLVSFISIHFFSGCIKRISDTGLAPINQANDKTTGSSSRDLLTEDNYSSLTIEVQYMKGFEPDEFALNILTSFLNSLVYKSGGITISKKEIEAEGKTSYSISDIATIEQKNRTAYNTGKNIAVYILITDGPYSNHSALGVSYRNTSLCLFGKTIFDISNSPPGIRTVIEATVAEHEFGHLLGLVDLGSPMIVNHEDTVNENHCDVKNCLMYYKTETESFFGFSNDIPTLDSQCLQDLHANGGK